VKNWIDNLPENDICLIGNVGIFNGIGHDGRIHKTIAINDCIYTSCPMGTQAYFINKEIIYLLYNTQMKELKKNKIFIADGLHIHCKKSDTEYLKIITPINNSRFINTGKEISMIKY
jgi:hypothetical protein